MGFYDSGPGSWEETPDYTAELYAMMNGRGQRQVMTQAQLASLPPIDTSMPQMPRGQTEDQEDAETIGAIGSALSGIVGAYGLSGGAAGGAGAAGATSGVQPAQTSQAVAADPGFAGTYNAQGTPVYTQPAAGPQGANITYNALGTPVYTQPANAMQTPTAPVGTSTLKGPVIAANPTLEGWYDQSSVAGQVTNKSEEQALLMYLLGHGIPGVPGQGGY